MVEFLNGITIFSPVRCPPELFTYSQWMMQHRVREVEEERAVLAGLNKLQGFIGIQPCQLRGIRRAFHNLVIPQQRDTTLVFVVHNFK